VVAVIVRYLLFVNRSRKFDWTAAIARFWRDLLAKLPANSEPGCSTMWSRLFLGLVLAVALVAGYPYASLILNSIIGTYTVVFTERDGLQRSLIIGPNAPRLDWLPLLPRSIVVQAGHWLPSPGREVAGDLVMLTHTGVDEIKRFYIDRLGASGFDLRDIGFGSLDAPTANYLGIANMLEGYRSDDGVSIKVTTLEANGVILPSRSVQIHWHKWDKSLPAGP
jgi:hypothetical protein